jgi:hypothetical protein
MAVKICIQTKPMKCGRDSGYLFKVLAGEEAFAPPEPAES